MRRRYLIQWGFGPYGFFTHYNEDKKTYESNRKIGRLESGWFISSDIFQKGETHHVIYVKPSKIRQRSS
jgi:hypothetical protein